MEAHTSSTGAPPAEQGRTGDTSGASSGAPVVWVRVAALARELEVDPRRVREWVTRHVPETARKRRARAGGGSAELCVTMAAAVSIREHFTSSGDGTGAPGAQAPAPERRAGGEERRNGSGANGAPPANQGRTTGAPGAQGRQAAGEAHRRTGEATGAGAATAAVDPAAGWREALAAERGRTAAAVAEADHLRSELERERVARQAAARHAEEAERGRHVAEARIEALRAAWWRWYALLTSRAFWRVRRLPTVPPELTAGPALPPPEGEARWRRPGR